MKRFVGSDTTPKREQLEVSEKKPNPAQDQPSTCGKNPPVEFFEWPIELSEAQRKEIKSSKPGLLAGVGHSLDGLLERLLDGSTTFELMEVSQLLNPIIRSELRTIKRVYKQPAMTPADQERLRKYKKDHKKQQVALDNDDCKANVEDNLFKLERVDESSKKYRVRYASERIPFSNVIAITYAWHETEKKNFFHVYGRKETKPIQLGVEWDVTAVLKTLEELSKDNWIWMDQFSLIQDKVTTKALCSDIPTIYRNSRVVAFLPYTICRSLLKRIKAFRKQDTPNVSAALAELMFHDLVCECTDGLYGWLSRLWTWQEFMLASSLRLVWGLGESRWTKREIFKEDLNPQGERNDVVSHALGIIGDAGKSVKHVVKHSITNISVFDQPTTRLLSELTKRNTESVIIHEADTASLSMGYYFCVRLMCGAEVYMPSASQVLPINCLKVLQQIASTGRKGGSMYDCYYAAGAFLEDATFLPDKKNFRSINDLDEGDNNAAGDEFIMADKAQTLLEIKEELALRAAYFEFYEYEQSKQSYRSRNIQDNPTVQQNFLLERYARKFKDINKEDIRDLEKALTELNIPVVKHCGVPVPSSSGSKSENSKDTFRPLAWNKKATSRKNLVRMDSKTKELDNKKGILMKRLIAVSEEKKDSKDGLLNAFVLSGMNEEAFYETQRCESRGEVLYGTAHDIQSHKTIKVGGTFDLCFASIYKIVANMHPSQLTRARNFNTIPTEMNLSLYPIAHAIIHATCYSSEEHPAHLAQVLSGLRAKKITAEDYVNAVALLVGEGFDFILDEDKNRENQFELVKIYFSDGTRCVGIVSKLPKKRKPRSTPDSEKAKSDNEKGKGSVESTTVSEDTPANPTKKSVQGTSAVAATRMFVKKSVAEVGTTASKAVSQTQSALNEGIAGASATAAKVVTQTEAFMKENEKDVLGAVVKTTTKYAATKLTAAAFASYLSRASIKVVKSHHRLLLCTGGDTDVSDWSVVGYIPGFDAEANKAVLGPISHFGVQIKLNMMEEEVHSPAASSA